ncbi:MAG: hypothetical protein ABW187_04035 [Dokdonella sp.]
MIRASIADVSVASSPVARRCAACVHFDGAAQTLETEIPGLAVMSSGYASVRADDGLCALHHRYLSGRSGCDAFAQRVATYA